MTVRIIQGDVRDELPKLAADSFDCIVTSPPYYCLRDYGTATWEGGDPACNHRMPNTLIRNNETSTIGRSAVGEKSRGVLVNGLPFKDVCGKCGARRVDAQIGLEPTLDAYLETIVAVCRELRRVLKPSGVFFLNIGDSYAREFAKGHVPIGLKPKDLMLVPERLGITLQADGWWVRSRIVWSKPNPMPESVTDRPTSAHETIWMLAKSPRYFWDDEAVKEGLSVEPHAPGNKSYTFDGSEKMASQGGGQGKIWGADGTRNIRNVWTIATHPFPGAHFATFPPALVERCIKAACPSGGHVFDPFAGSGTVGLVADRLGRDATLIDLNTSYIDMAVDRIRDDAPLFTKVAAE